jgi:hypothetical protein
MRNCAGAKTRVSLLISAAPTMSLKIEALCAAALCGLLRRKLSRRLRSGSNGGARWFSTRRCRNDRGQNFGFQYEHGEDDIRDDVPRGRTIMRVFGIIITAVVIAGVAALVASQTPPLVLLARTTDQSTPTELPMDKIHRQEERQQQAEFPVDSLEAKLPKWGDPQVLQLLEQAIRRGVKNLGPLGGLLTGQIKGMQFSEQRLQANLGSKKLCGADVSLDITPLFTNESINQDLKVEYVIQFTEEGALYVDLLTE